jgi:hypothetical protein
LLAPLKKEIAMDIKVQKVRGGYRACFTDNDEYGGCGKTFEEAIGKLIVSEQITLGINRIRGNLVTYTREDLGITSVDWDNEDEWTTQYRAGGCNRGKKVIIEISFDHLPLVEGLDEARQIKVCDIRECLPPHLYGYINRMSSIPGNDGRVIGYFSEFTEAELSKKNGFGPKRLDLLKQLLHHYGLEFKKE